MWLSDVFTNYELECKTRDLFQVYRENKNLVFDKFEEYFGISYKLAFGNKDPNLGIYDLLEEYYPNEFYIKKAFSMKYLKNSNQIFEYPVGDCRADIINVGKDISCYEIKTKYDNLKRLKKQIYEYSQLFEYVYVVCSEDKYNKVKSIVPKHCGIIVFKNRKNCAYNEMKKATKSPNISSRAILEHFYQKDLINCYGENDKDDIEKKYSKENILQDYKKVLYRRCID